MSPQHVLLPKPSVTAGNLRNLGKDKPAAGGGVGRIGGALAGTGLAVARREFQGRHRGVAERPFSYERHSGFRKSTLDLISEMSL